MRLFIAFDVPDDVKEYMARIQGIIGDNLAEIRWVKKEQMHLTLKFLGEVQPNAADKIKDELRKIRFDSFTVYLNSIGVFPNENYIRVVWVGLEPEDKIIGLQRSIDENLKEFFKKEKDFKAHITLGRVKYVKNKEQFLSKLKGIKVEKKNFRVDKFKLMKSTLTMQGPLYEAVEEFGP
ncbi:RNA 2',3'-cyclic phosphodiesterase [Candidatus Woesearchaeota archaeon]|nr:RNA 2',3'-cyclic phosphodiesterase [Candidatus Woesearchaeota archaeon]